MTAIWQNDGTSWHLLVPTGFPNEATLHDLVEQAPHLLPLAGSPRLIVIGREVPEATQQARSRGEGRLVEGVDDFAAGLDAAPASVRTLLRKLCDWAVALEQA